MISRRFCGREVSHVVVYERKEHDSSQQNYGSDKDLEELSE